MANNTIEPRRLQRRLPIRERNPAPAEPPRQEQAEGPRLDAPVRSRPANENEPGTAAMIAGLRRKPSSAPYGIALFITLLWVFSWFWSNSGALFGQPDAFSPARMPQTISAVIDLVLPIMLTWAAAYFLYRAQQLRDVSEVLVHSAMRLIRPQDAAVEGLSSIAQSVRADVDILVGGVEHAVQRATELESIVHKEISAIERAFGGNEERIRTLVAGLENQRAALQQAGTVIGNEASPLLSRLETNTQGLDNVVNAAQSTLALLKHSLKSSTVELARTIDEVANRALSAEQEISGQAAQMDRTSALLTNELRQFSDHLTNQIDTLTKATASLSAETTTFGHNVQGMEAGLVGLLRNTIGELTNINGEIAQTISNVAASSSEDIRATGTQLTELLQSTGGNIVYHLKETSQEVAQQIEKSGIVVSEQIETSRSGLTDGLQGIIKEYVDEVERARSGLVTYVDQASEQLAGRLEELSVRPLHASR